MADIKRHRYLGIGVFIITAAVIITTTTSWLLYNHTVNLLTDNLRKRLLAIVTTAVVEIDAEDINALKIESDWKKPEWRRVVDKIYKIKANNDDILFIYIL